MSKSFFKNVFACVSIKKQFPVCPTKKKSKKLCLLVFVLFFLALLNLGFSLFSFLMVMLLNDTTFLLIV